MKSPEENLETMPAQSPFHAQGKHPDVKLEIEDDVLPRQRSMPVCKSEHFHPMFGSSFKENCIAVNKPIVSDEVDAEMLKKITHMVETERLHVDNSNICDLLRVSGYLQLRARFVEDQCAEYLRVNSCKPISNALEILSFAQVTGLRRFIDLLRIHILAHVRHFLEDVRFMDISFHLLSVLLECNENDNYDTSSPSYVRGNALLTLVLRWIDHSREQRHKYRDTLMNMLNSSNNVSTEFALSLLNDRVHFINRISSLAQVSEREQLAVLLKAHIVKLEILPPEYFASIEIPLDRLLRLLKIFANGHDNACKVCPMGSHRTSTCAIRTRGNKLLMFVLLWINHEHSKRYAYYDLLTAMIDSSNISIDRVLALLSELECFIDKWVIRNTNPELLVNLKELYVSCPERTFTFKVENFSQMKPKDSGGYTPLHTIDEPKWIMYAKDRFKFLCYGKPAEGLLVVLLATCDPNARYDLKPEISLVSQVVGVQNLTKKAKPLAVSVRESFCITYEVSFEWREIVTPTDVFLKNDLLTVEFSTKCLK